MDLVSLLARLHGKLMDACLNSEFKVSDSYQGFLAFVCVPLWVRWVFQCIYFLCCLPKFDYQRDFGSVYIGNHVECDVKCDVALLFLRKKQ